MAALLLAACVAPAPGPLAAVETDRARLVGALPPQEAARGVYVVDLERAGELSPGSRLAPVVAPLVDDADLLVETAAPPITLLGGVDEDVGTPDGAARLDDVLVFAPEELRDAIVARLEDRAQPEGRLAELAASREAVGWAGPTPSPDGSGTTVITLGENDVTFSVEVDGAVEPAAEHARRELAEGGPAGSPGKRWADILGDAEVAVEDDRLIVTGTPVDLPGLLLRVLVDQRQITFLPG